MANLTSLIRLRRHRIEEKQKILAGLYRKAEEIENRRAQLETTLENERASLSADSTADMLAYYGRYSKTVIEQIEQENDALEKINMRIRIAQDDIRTAFIALKQIEIVQEAREKEERTEQNKKESQDLDEIGMTRFSQQG